MVLAVLLTAGAAAPALATSPASSPAAPAPAAVLDACEQQADAQGYAPRGRCELVLLRAEGICLGAAPVLDYAVEAIGTSAGTLTLTWRNPQGEDLVQEGLPLSGRVYWPGTVVQDGVVVDWPGWTLDDSGSWVEHDAYDFTRPEVTVTLEVNPSLQTVVSYPPESAECAGPRVERVASVQTTSGVLAAPELPAAPVEVASAVLAATGVTTGPLLLGGGALLLLGVTLVALAARRRHHLG
ncbi:peptidase [Cellulomonas triticagri]|uniref:Peptidase n=1 Tax=Cellulomonas triticagri TaxID=2483352 RepID=A0A3M2JPE4_9CELL|nr:peptidase [Cellulomonas triticagri]